MYIKRKRGWELPESAATAEAVYLNRREFAKGLAAGPVLLALGAGGFGAGVFANMGRPRRRTPILRPSSIPSSATTPTSSTAP